MLMRYLSKFLLDILPPVFATVVGAWIVTHYVNPRSDAAQPKTEASATKAPLSGASGMSPRNVEQVAVKPVIDETAEAKRAIREKPVAVKQAVAAPRTDEKRETPRDATDLARAALDRLRNQAPPEAPHASQAMIQPVSAPATPAAIAAPAPVATPAPAIAASAPPALPPPIVIAPQRELAVQQPSPSLFDPGRPTPPADIPVRSADASMQPEAHEGRSLIGGVVSAARSLVDVVIPR